MVDMTAPTANDVICDPACGTAGFLIAASEFLQEHHSAEIYKNEESRYRFNQGTFHGYDFDSTMLRIGSMNMLLHGVENPDIRYKDSLAQADQLDEEKYSLLLANPPLQVAWITSPLPRICNRWSKPRRPSCSFWPCFSACCGPGAGQQSLCRTGFCSDRARPIRRCARSWWRSRSWTRSSPCPRACSSPMPGSPRPSSFHQDQLWWHGSGLVLRHALGRVFFG